MLTLLVIVMAAVAMPSHADAADGYTLTSATTYRVDPSAPAVRVESTYRMTNTTPDVELSDGRTRFYYYEGVTLPLETGARDITVEVNGSSAQFEVVGDDDRHVDVAGVAESQHWERDVRGVDARE